MATLRTIRITSRDHPGLAPYLTLKQSEGHENFGIFVTQGEKNVRRLLRSPCRLVSMLATETWLERMRPFWECRNEAIDVFIGEKAFIESVIDHKMYQAVMAVARIPDPATVAEVLSMARDPRLLVATDGLSNADNLGSIMRSAAAFGADGLIVGESCCGPYLRRTVRSSMGAVFDLPIVQPESLAETLRDLRRSGIRTVAAHARAEARCIGEADLRSDICLVLGSEGTGPSDDVLAVCDDAVYIPMAGEVDSLNVATAAAVFLYETVRQRGLAEPTE